MANCNICGNEISDEQYNNFNGMCSKCIRLTPLRNQAVGKKKMRRNMCIFMFSVITFFIFIWFIFVILY
ncbi:MAG: hypothetical protein ACFFC3_11225 [Candidatus Odinarchaeota archaeon]